MSETKIKYGFYKVRPAGRHLISIGRDLIKDKYAAIVELVKNAYDADSPTCYVSLMPFEEKFKEDDQIKIRKKIKIVIRDEGHGMGFDTVTLNWMVPSTDVKLRKKESPSGRKMQGRKGLGRYSTSVLGDDLVLETVNEQGSLTSLYLIWENFETAEYLEDVDVLIENFQTNRNSGTEIVITGGENHLYSWTDDQLKRLRAELKRLIPPINKDIELKGVNDDTENFKIKLEFGDFPNSKYANIKENIEPYPLFELFDYQIYGTVSNEGVANLKFHNKRIKGASIEILDSFKIHLNQNEDKDLQNYCGELKIDFRVFDRDSSSIDSLIERGLKDFTTGDSVGKREARRILDTYNGIGVYRNGFRLRPLGDAGYDWLSLDKERFLQPTLRISSNQIIGFIHIQPEESSGLEEKSGRDGIKESPEYFGLIEIAKKVLQQLENRRFAYRQKVGLGRSKRHAEEKINKLYNFKDVQEKIEKELALAGVSIDKRKKINELLEEKEKNNNKIANELKQIIALYQGQATVGKIVNVVLHEGRKPISYFKNQIPIIEEWRQELIENYSDKTLEKIVSRLAGINEQSDIFIKLFKKLDPLSTKRRSPKKDFFIRPIIETVQDVFISQLELQEIQYLITCDINESIYGWKEDFYIIFTNLVDNSIYWLQNSSLPKQISFIVYEDTDENILTVEYRDNGPGIPQNLIESEQIFEPEFSNKTGSGSGLGLAISGEAAERNNGKLKAIYSEEGAYFKLEIKKQ